MSPKPSGRGICAAHTGNVRTRVLPASRSMATNSSAATASRMLMAAAMLLLTSRARPACLPASNGVTASVSRRCSRAATAAPSMPTARVRCRTSVEAPSMPVPNSARNVISNSGSRTAAVNKMARRAFSMETNAPLRRVLGPAARVVFSTCVAGMAISLSAPGTLLDSPAPCRRCRRGLRFRANAAKPVTPPHARPARFPASSPER